MKKRASDIEDRDPRSGMIIVLVLWTIALLAALAMAASVSFRGFAGIVALDSDRAKADALMQAGLEVAGGLVAKLGDQPLAAQQTTVRLQNGSVLIRLSDEGGKIDVNKASVPLLIAMLQAAGAENAKMIAQSIDRWRQEDGMGQAADANAANATLAQQSTAQTPQPVQTPQAGQNAAQPAAQQDDSKKDDGFRSFTDLRQLVQVPGVTRGIVENLIPLATVYGDEKINLLTASHDVLAALPGLGEAQVAALLDARNKPLNKDWFMQLAGPAKDYVRAEGRTVALVEMAANLPDGYRTAARAVIVVVPEDKQPYRVLSWMPLQVREHRIATQF